MIVLDENNLGIAHRSYVQSQRCGCIFYNCTITFLGDGAQKATAFEHIILLSNYAVHVFGLHNYQALVPQPYVVTMRI